MHTLTPTRLSVCRANDVINLVLNLLSHIVPVSVSVVASSVVTVCILSHTGNLVGLFYVGRFFPLPAGVAVSSCILLLALLLLS